MDTKEIGLCWKDNCKVKATHETPEGGKYCQAHWKEKNTTPKRQNAKAGQRNTMLQVQTQVKVKEAKNWTLTVMNGNFSDEVVIRLTVSKDDGTKHDTIFQVNAEELTRAIENATNQPKHEQ